MSTLDDLMIFHGSDKASQFTRTYAKPKGYCQHYERCFGELRDKPMKIAEVGVGGGESIRGWLEYFPAARVFGVDIVSNTNPWDTPGTNDRYTFVTGNQGDPVFWQCFIADYGVDWDICIDDGSHINSDIITTFNALWPHVRPGGFYAIEDLGVAYSQNSIFLKPGFPNHIDWLRSNIDALNAGAGIDSMYFSRELCVFRKAL